MRPKKIGIFAGVTFLALIVYLYIDYKVSNAKIALENAKMEYEVLSHKLMKLQDKYDEVKDEVKDAPTYYPWITSMSWGPKKWHEKTIGYGKEMESGLHYRVAVTTAEIYSGVNVELIAQGEEGCCMRIKSNQVLDLDNLQKKYQLVGELAGFEVTGWKNFNNFTFSIHNRLFLANIVDKNTIEVKELPRKNGSDQAN